ncbi:MAG TPA: TetR family transcriptional regulator C-terminal domain-containing protein [Streptosporangiaceae bacterium]|jgi:AcrR family transcriptional regulator
MTSTEATAPHRGTRRSGRRKVEVLEAACRVIAERGAEATRFTDVAAASAVPVSTLQYYFGSREDLLVAAFRHASDAELAELEADVAQLGDPWEQLTCIATRALAGYRPPAADTARSGKLWIESWHFALRDAEMRADTLRDYTAWRRLIAGAVRAGMDSGRFTARLAPDRAAILINALLDGIGIPLALYDPDITLDGAIAECTSVLADLLGLAH